MPGGVFTTTQYTSRALIGQVAPQQAGNDGHVYGEGSGSGGASGAIAMTLHLSQVSGSPENLGQFNVKRAAA